MMEVQPQELDPLQFEEYELGFLDCYLFMNGIADPGPDDYADALRSLRQYRDRLAPRARIN